MTIIIRRRTIFALLACAIAHSAYASFFPGADSITAAKSYAILVKQLHQLQQQVDLSRHMLAQGKETLNTMKGSYGQGAFLDGPKELGEYERGGATWRETLSQLSGGNNERYQQLLAAYSQNSHLITTAQFSKGQSQSLSEQYDDAKKNNHVSTALSDYEYEQVNRLRRHIHQMTERIDHAPNIKSSMDLNSRLVAELSYISLEQLRMQTLLNHQYAQHQTEALRDDARSALYNRLPKEH